jgi:hypothetical protein
LRPAIGYPGEKMKLVGSKLPWMMIMILGIILVCHTRARAFTAYHCWNRSNIAESYLLLKPDACAALEGNAEVEMIVYGEIVQMKQDRIIPIFRCQVIETIVSQYCRHRSSSIGVTRYIQFRELKPLEAWDCRQARTHGKVVISGSTIKATIGATISHAMLLSGGLGDGSNCMAGTISFPNGKTLGAKLLKDCMKSLSKTRLPR